MKAYRRIITYGILISEIEVIIWKYVRDPSGLIFLS